MPELARTSALGHVRKLTFFETPFWTAEAQHLAASPYLGNLRELEIGFTDTQIGPDGAVALGRAKSIRQLQKLDVHNHAIYDDGAEALLYSERLATLTDIHLGNNGLTDDTLVALSHAYNLKLKSLDLMRNHLSGLGLAALDGTHLAGLEFLSVQGNVIGHDGAVNLARMPFVASLRDLRVADCGMDDKALAVLLGAAWSQLTELSLTMNRFGSRAVKALTANRSLARLEVLRAARCEIGPTTARGLGRASLPGLHTLWLGANPLGEQGLRALLSGPLVRTVQTLHLDDARLGDNGAEALARSPTVANVRTLWLSKNRITDRGAAALVESPHLANVQSLYMPDNELGKKGREALVKRFGKRVNVGTT
jgi:Ran GTPase-activating protein (RanGAP) involved in mRNA processing and transport